MGRYLEFTSSYTLFQVNRHIILLQPSDWLLQGSPADESLFCSLQPKYKTNSSRLSLHFLRDEVDEGELASQENVTVYYLKDKLDNDYS